MSSNVPNDAVKPLIADSEANGKDEQALLAKKALVPLDVSEICNGCRCGWLCCDCNIGCLSCKERLRYCYCSWNSYFGIQHACMFCVILLPACHCCLERRCKWCLVSLIKCKRGGCIKKLPDRLSPDAQIYVDIFNMEEGPEDDDIVAGSGNEDGKANEEGVAPSMPAMTAGNLSRAAASLSCSSLGSAAEYYSETESTSLDLETSFGSQDGFESAGQEGERCSR